MGNSKQKIKNKIMINEKTENENVLELTKAVLQLLDYVKKTDPYVVQKMYFENLPQYVKASHIKKILEVSSVTIWTWEKEKILIPIEIKNRKYYNKADILDLCQKRNKKYIN